MTPSPSNFGGRDLMQALKNNDTAGMSNKFLNMVRNSDRGLQNIYAIKLENIRKRLNAETN